MDLRLFLTACSRITPFLDEIVSLMINDFMNFPQYIGVIKLGRGQDTLPPPILRNPI